MSSNIKSDSIKKYTELLNAKEGLRLKAKTLLTTNEFNKLSSLFTDFEIAYMDLMSSTYNHLFALQNQTNSLKEVKIDPYIAGGIGQGLGGVGVGVGAALTADARNKSIDAKRSQSKKDVEHTRLQEDSSHNQISSIYSSIMQIINENSALKNYLTSEINKNYKLKELKEKQEAERQSIQDENGAIAAAITVIFIAFRVALGKGIISTIFLSVLVLIISGIGLLIFNQPKK